MTTKVSLMVVGRDLFDESVDDTLLEIFDYAILVTQRGRNQVFSIFVDDEIVVKEAVDAARKIEQHVVGAKVVGVERDPVTVSDIAQRVNVSREAVRKWSNTQGFPVADGYLDSASMEFWSWTKISDWLWESRSIDMEDKLPTMTQLADIDHYLNDKPEISDSPWHSVPSKHSNVIVLSEQQRNRRLRLMTTAQS